MNIVRSCRTRDGLPPIPITHPSCACKGDRIGGADRTASVRVSYPGSLNDTGGVAEFLAKGPSCGQIFDEDQPLVRIPIQIDFCIHLIIRRDGKEPFAEPAIKVEVGG